ncbi:Type I phosphodiesterase/nucleotide pyrophosphatase, partial [Tolypocladium paradoxum]
LETGYWYKGALASAPSDSFPGTVSLVSGADPAMSGIWYDDAYDRTLWNPYSQTKSNCQGPPGSEVLYDETKDYDHTKLWSSPNPTVVGGNIDPQNLPQAKVGGKCINLYPHQRLRVNTVFEVAHRHGQTAYTDKHPAYDLVRGPSGKGLSVGYFPEIQSLDTTNVTQIIGYDALHVQAFIDWIGGKSPANTEVQEALTGPPMLFGGNFQAVSVAQKSYGYQAGSLAFTDQLVTALTFVDNSLGHVVAELQNKGIFNDTLIFVCGKHGQAPIDPKLYRKINQHLIEPSSGVKMAQVTADDIALLWLDNQNDLSNAVAGLIKNKTLLAISDIIYGNRLVAEGYGNPTTDPAVPDIIIVPEHGVIYTTSSSKKAEHGGFSSDDRNVACFVSSPGLKKQVFTQQVATAQVAPTILQALGLKPAHLVSVKRGNIDNLPGFDRQ